MNITLSNPVVSRLANDYVMSFLHHTGENTKHITDKQATDIKFYHADGFGKLTELPTEYNSELLQDMLFDWSHVRDSSDEAFLAMAKAINDCVSYEAKSADSMLDFKIFVANYFQDLRRNWIIMLAWNQATSEIERIEDELYHETQI